jgi:hypothetical protein
MDRRCALARSAKKKSAAKKRVGTRRPRRRKANAAQAAATTPVTAAGETDAPAAADTRRPSSGSSAGYRAKVRMYRQGLGDCFLISLPRNDDSNRPFYLMIDCGVVLGTQDPGTIMTKVMDHIVKTTGGRIDVLVATHEHWDHLSGFVQASKSFDGLKVGEVWLAWTEDPHDDLANELRADKEKALGALRMGLSHLQIATDAQAASDTSAVDELTSVLEFFGMAKGATTSGALKNVRDKVDDKPRYLNPEDKKSFVPPGIDARFYVLGPPHDKKWLRKINPSKDKETYGLALANLGLFMDGAGSAMAQMDEGRPFDQQYEIPFTYAQSAPELKFFREHYFQPEGAAPDNWRRIDGDWLAGASEMALQLDSLTNNTSLVLAIELEPNGDVLLFAADAQVGNWMSWQELSWTVNDKTVHATDLLDRAIFYKVGHHGSHNATLKEKGLQLMKNLRVAMIPVNHEMAVKKRWGKMPLDELVDALKQQARGVVLRVDDVQMPGSNETVTEDDGPDKLFYEVTF